MAKAQDAPESAGEKRAATEAFSGWNGDPWSFESAELAIHVVDPAGLIVEVNRAFEILFGASRGLYLNKHQAILNPGPIAVGLRLLEGIRADVNRQGAWRGVTRNERFNGTTFQSLAHVYPMRAGARRGYLVFFQQEHQVSAQLRAPIATSEQDHVFLEAG